MTRAPRTRLLLALLATALMGATAACHDLTFDCGQDAHRCYSSEPENGPLILRLSPNAENPTIPIAIYRGRVEDSVLVWTDTTAEARYEVMVELDQWHAAVATYRQNGRTIQAIDWGRPWAMYRESCACFSLEKDELRLEVGRYF